MDSKCPLFNVSGLIGKRWSLMILAELYRGRVRWKRYSVIKKGLPGITPKMLSMRLRELEKQRLLKRRLEAETFPVKSEYILTPMGRDLVGVIREMRQWAIKWKIGNSHCEVASCEECDI
jgi:DNA-binding HxlR family transcriptional regulator